MTPLQALNHRLPALALALLFLILDQFGLFDPLERLAYDRGLRALARPAETRVALITIDDATLVRLGPWPLAPRHHLRLLEILQRAEPRVVAFTEPITTHEPSEEASLRALGALFRQTGNVVLPLPADWSDADGSLTSTPPAYLLQTATPPAPDTPWRPDAEPAWITPFDWPREELGPQATRIGVNLVAPDPDRVVRAMPLLMRAGERLLPSLPLAATLMALRAPAGTVRPDSFGTLELADTRISTQNGWRIRPWFHPGGNLQPEFAHFSMLSILDGKIPPERFRDLVVLIGLDSDRVTTRHATPMPRAMSPLELHAQTVSALLDGQSFFIPDWARSGRLILFGVVTLLLLLAPPLGIGAHLATLAGAVTLAIAVPVAHVRLLDLHGLWVPMIAPLALLGSGAILPQMLRWWFGASEGFSPRTREHDLHLALGLAYQGQMCWELAQEQFRLVPMDARLLAMSDHLARDLENARRHADAVRLYQRMLRFAPGDAPLRQRLATAQQHLAGEVGGAGPTFPMTEERAARTVGDYPIVAELSHDPLGLLLLGRDALSGKPVILRLPQPPRHPSPARAEKARRRFLTDGQKALKWPHEGVVELLGIHLSAHPPHLVMAHFPVHGNLERHLHPDDPLPLSLILYIGTRAAMALDHAHQRGLTHGNLRPEDILYDPKSREVWIKEFGLARYLGIDPGSGGISPHAAPELMADGAEALEQDGEARADLYALA
ncbi:MAG: CHASE2 domain-containing protein, partial [Magnetococcales bacterium]|nr:CHASE2 domain-containing protein [Magnetococcales bacterium]